MASDLGRRTGGFVRWIGWPGLVLLVIVVAGVIYGLRWERLRHAPVPEGAQQVQIGLNADIRQTTFRIDWTAPQLREYYRQALPGRGWSYCGTQADAGCTNLTQLVDRDPSGIDIYRRPDDEARQGPTLEIWPIEAEGGQLFVTVYETSGG
jgi:hypothetical protein